MPIAILVSCIAMIIAIFSLVNAREQVDGEEFVKDINKQLDIMTARFDGILKKELDEVRGEYKKGFELSIEHHEELGTHMNENFCKTFENAAELDSEIKVLWMKLEKLGVKRYSKRGRPRKNKGELK